MSNASTLPLDQLPALAPPPGVTPNFTDPWSFNAITIATVTICLTFTTIALGIRLATKLFLMRTIQLEDYLVTTAWVGYVAYTVLTLIDGLEGFDMHQWDVSVATALELKQRSSIAEIIYCPIIALAKAALVLQLLHIFSQHTRGFLFWAFHAQIWTNALFYLAVMFAIIFECWPREAIWNPEVTGTCINTQAVFIATGAFNIVWDVTALCLPLYAISQLQLPLRKKIGAIAVFATAIFSLVSTIARLVYTVDLFGAADQTFWTGQVGLWSLAEIATIILCTCFPVVPRFAQKVRGTTRARSTYPTGHAYSMKRLRQSRSAMGPKSDVLQSHTDDVVPLHGAYTPIEDQHRLEVESGRGIQKTVRVDVR